MKLYHEVRGCSLAVDIVARELGIDLDLEWVDMVSKRLQDGSDYHLVNSKGTVPTLELPNGDRISEGAVIMQYLADLRPERRLLPPHGSIKRLRVLEWMSFVGADLHKGGFMPLFKANTPPEYREIARQYLGRHLTWLDSQLADRTVLVGEDFTIADAHCYTIAMWTAAHDISTETWPNLTRYLKQIGSRPSVQEAERAAYEQGQARLGATAPGD
ncbi:MAG: glutathione transferase GstA [Alphaproteobacteria bacterium]|nr:glutathione transferase GstA [Alphaproteobacteria bacterium]MBU0794407.1 glutathione transferase GstA [Alphaproteobacteria bacterium]MBU0874415.1 glutathione transferase GstA [Alphaproteobacteria bacterium]MBU1768540.1 glutathione transferase GstA [Alphaproteobacteria bacterium]